MHRMHANAWVAFCFLYRGWDASIHLCSLWPHFCLLMFFLQQKCSVQRKLSDKMLVWLSVWNLVHIVCIWSSWCHCHPNTLLSFATFKSRLILSFWYRLYQVVLEKRPLNRCSCSSSSISYIQCRCVWISVLWRCWLGSRKGIRPVKNWVVGCWHGYLSGASCRLAYGPADTTATYCLLLQ